MGPRENLTATGVNPEHRSYFEFRIARSPFVTTFENLTGSRRGGQAKENHSAFRKTVKNVRDGSRPGSRQVT